MTKQTSQCTTPVATTLKTALSFLDIFMIFFGFFEFLDFFVLFVPLNMVNNTLFSLRLPSGGCVSPTSMDEV